LQYVMGIDVGSQGVRILVTDLKGRVVAGSSRNFPQIKVKGLPAEWFEQRPQDWWDAVLNCIKDIAKTFSKEGYSLKEIGAAAVDSTSGTIIPLAQDCSPLRDAIMYNDPRAGKESELLQEKGKELSNKLGYSFKSSFALPRILWIKENEPEIYADTRRFIHAADFINGKLSGNYGITDHTNALKTGFDLIDYRWPALINELGIDQNLLPEVVPPGSIIGIIDSYLAKDLGLSPELKVVTGMTDGCAAQLSSGAVEPGQWNTTIGTTLVLKGITKELIKDEKGRLYCHLNPEGYWIPGGASNTGGKCLNDYFPGYSLAELDQGIIPDKPGDLYIYPLTGRGERFPFVNKEARGFIHGDVESIEELYQGFLEGVGYIERVAYDLMEDLGAIVGPDIYVTGGAVKSRPWLQIRANILNKRLLQPVVSESAMGAAITAASKTCFHDSVEAAKEMVTIAQEIEPQEDTVSLYDDKYRKFCEILKNKGYIKDGGK